MSYLNLLLEFLRSFLENLRTFLKDALKLSLLDLVRDLVVLHSVQHVLVGPTMQQRLFLHLPGLQLLLLALLKPGLELEPLLHELLGCGLLLD